MILHVKYFAKFKSTQTMNVILCQTFSEREREGGQCDVYYTSPQSFIRTFSYSFAEQLWGL